MSHGRWVIVLLAVAGALSGSATGFARSARPQPGPVSVTFTRDIAPLIFEHCTPCHRPGDAAPFSLLTYHDVSLRAAQIVRVTTARQMPPWKPEPGHGDFAEARRLTEQQIAVIQRWVLQGAVEGHQADLPPTPQWPSDWQLGKPDVVVTMPESYPLEGGGQDVFRTFVLPIPTSERRHVKGLEFRAGGSKAVHHANMKIDRTRASRRQDDEQPGPGFEGGAGRTAQFPDGHFLGWTPGQVPHMLPDEMAWQLDPNSDLVVQAHLMPTDGSEPVRISVALYFSNQPPTRLPYMLRLGRHDIDIPPGDKAHSILDTYVLPVDVELLSVQPHAHLLARQVSGDARLPDGTMKSLIFIKDWDFRWQEVYKYREPVRLPKGTTLLVRFTYDNSAGNVRNHHRPPQRVTYGQTTHAEMGDLWLQVMTPTVGDRQVLDRHFVPKMVRDDIIGEEKTLEVTPNDVQLRDSLAVLYFESGRIADAIRQMEAAVRLRPARASGHYNLGTVFFQQQRFDAAGQAFAEAVKLKPDYSEAHNSLGIVQQIKGQADEAIASLGRAIQAWPDNIKAHYNLARMLASLGRVGEAISEYRTVLQKGPDGSEARRSPALDVAPEVTSALVDLAVILATSDEPGIWNPDEAVRLAERAAAVTGSRNATVLDALGVAYFSAGRTGEAVSTAQAALNLAVATGTPELVTQIRDRLALYRQAR
jgi:tetratricopeptide (TPR) repeat protein